MVEGERLLGLDVGKRRVGVAVSDPLGVSARPLTTVARTSDGTDLERLAKLAREYQATRLVVGLPRHLDGREAELAAEVRTFAQRLAQRCQLPLVWAEERLSSKEAERVLAELGVAPEKRRRRRDEIAAALILTWYLESR
jgi:putative Holliday junction resolvase